MNKIMIEVRTGKGSINEDNSTYNFTDTFETISRIPKKHSCWHSVTYNGSRYQLHGGIHTNYFICINDPIKKKK